MQASEKPAQNQTKDLLLSRVHLNRGRVGNHDACQLRSGHIRGLDSKIERRVRQVSHQGDPLGVRYAFAHKGQSWFAQHIGAATRSSY